MEKKPPKPQAEPSQHPFGYSFHQYVATRVEPCAVDTTCKSVPFHLLVCGHIVAIDCDDTRCGLNCLHVSTWMTQKLSQPQQKSIDLTPGKSLFQALTRSAARPHNPTKPPESTIQGHDKLFCEMCTGIPFASYNLANPEHEFRRALGLTRPVIEHFTNYDIEVLNFFLSEIFYNPQHKDFEHKYTHYLSCGHEVWCAPVRPCAANCMDMPPCRGRIFPHNVKQGDAVLCKECTYRAELVYSRYITTGRGGAQEEAARNGLLDQAQQNEHNKDKTVGAKSENNSHSSITAFNDPNTSGPNTDMPDFGAYDGVDMFDSADATAGQVGLADGQNEGAGYGSPSGSSTYGELNLDPSLQFTATM
jgi:hypothetical protein